MKLYAPSAVTSSGGGSRKRVWGYTDPFRFPPSEYHRSLLQTVEPFLNLYPEGVLPNFDKFEGGAMRKDTLEAAVRIALSQYSPTTSVFSKAETELNVRPHHIALLQNLYLLTKPSENDEAFQRLKGYKRRGVSGRDDNEDISGFFIKCRGGEVKSNFMSWSSNEGIDTDHEAAPEDADDKKVQGRTDFRLFAWDKGPLIRLELTSTEKARLRTKTLKAVAESKLVEDKDAIFQAARYSRSEVLRNIEHWHVDPVFLITLAGKTWTYGIMDVHGIIPLRDNKFTDVDFKAFQRQEHAHWGSRSYVGTTVEELNERLKLGISQLREKYQEKPGALFPNQKYLVGNFYQANQWFPLPSVQMENGLVNTGCLHLFEGLMRIIIGERVLTWTPHDVRRAQEIQLNLHEELASIEGLKPTLEELEEDWERQRRRIEKVKKRRREPTLEELEEDWERQRRQIEKMKQQRRETTSEELQEDSECQQRRIEENTDAEKIEEA